MPRRSSRRNDGNGTRSGRRNGGNNGGDMGSGPYGRRPSKFKTQMINVPSYMTNKVCVSTHAHAHSFIYSRFYSLLIIRSMIG